MLVKVIQMAGLYGIIAFHEVDESYLQSFADSDNTHAELMR